MEADDPHYCQWEHIEHYAGTGRWEIQSHGKSAHWDIVVNEEGKQGAFLANRQWLDDKGRPEYESEYLARIDADYRASKEILENRFKTKVSAFSFPRGNCVTDLAWSPAKNQLAAVCWNDRTIRVFDIPASGLRDWRPAKEILPP